MNNEDHYSMVCSNFDSQPNYETNNDNKQDKKWADSQKDINSTIEAIKISVFDVASYILKKIGQISTIKLQKLVYYCQAWSMVWDEKPLFYENIEAWINGPVIRELYNYHRGTYIIDTLPIGNSDLLSEIQKETIDAVIDFYGDKTAQYLVELSHSEKPWIDARKDLPDNERSNKVIPLDLIQEYYSSL